MKLGERLQKERNKLNITQSEVAKKLRVSRQTISNWETSKSYPDLESLVSLSDYYNISLDVLLKEDDGMIKDVNNKLKFIGILKPVLYLLCFFFAIGSISAILVGLNGTGGLILMNASFQFMRSGGFIREFLSFIYQASKVFLLFFYLFNFLYAMKTQNGIFYKRLSILSIVLSIYNFISVEKFTTMPNIFIELPLIYLILAFVFAYLYSISKDNSGNTLKLKETENKLEE